MQKKAARQNRKLRTLGWHDQALVLRGVLEALVIRRALVRGLDKALVVHGIRHYESPGILVTDGEGEIGKDLPPQYLSDEP